MKYYIWTIGCQMNRAESQQMSNYLNQLGLEQVNNARQSDIAVLNTCVVRGNAENKVRGMLGFMKGIKNLNPGLRIVVMGCFVEQDTLKLKKLFPYVDYFFKPGLTGQFAEWLVNESILRRSGGQISSGRNENSVVKYIPIIQGCNNYCSYCIVPYRRGKESSRLPDDIIKEAATAVAEGAREIVLLGQNVNAYGHDLNQGIDLSSLLYQLHDLRDLLRIRFLTNHPKDMSSSLIDALASLPKLCHHICLPLQSGDDQILKAMNRHYTFDEYRSLVNRIRGSVHDIAISTDLIVGFPGETQEQFLNSLRAIQEIRFDVVHVAAYSPRSGTKAYIEYPDNVPGEIKTERLHDIESCQEQILYEKNSALIGSVVEVLVEAKKGGKWYGRTYSDKLVFFQEHRDISGLLVEVEITSVSPWTLQGEVI